MKKILIAAAILAAVACTKQEVKEKTETVAEKVAEKVDDVLDVNVPVGKDDPAERERQRLDQQWRDLELFRREAGAPAQAQGPATPELNLQFVTGAKETFKKIDPATIQTMPVNVPITGDVAGPSVLKAQVFLDRLHFSVGVLDGRWGRNSAISTWWYQRARGLKPTGEVDEATYRSLAAAAGNVPALISHSITASDLEGPFVSIPEDVYDKEKLDCLCYESVKEKLAERFHTTLDFLDQLNPDVKFSSLKEGDSIVVPNVRPPMTADQHDIASVVVSIAGNTFNAYDANKNLILHAPTTLGSKYDPSPEETVGVRKVLHDPHFHYQPKLFHEVPDTDPEAHLKPGPNSPVGVVWIALTKPHYGVHGTSDPDAIGYASSHGCVRLTNWDAKEVGHRIKPGVEIHFVDTRKKG